MTTTRDWPTARAKVDAEGRCRNCGGWPLDAHHVVPRQLGGDERAANIIPLCTTCHRGFHDGRITLRGVLRPEERANAAERAGGAWVAQRYPDDREEVPY